MLQTHSAVALALAAILMTPACGASLSDSEPSNTEQKQASERMGNSVNQTDIPISKRFRTLDEYLAHLEQTQGPVDGPWYKEVSPGVYELQTGNLHLDVPGGEKRRFTRQELERKFDFSK